jgi:hypothetical protein
VGGYETATANFNSYFFNPSVTFSDFQLFGDSAAIPSLRLGYSAIHQAGYTETGSTSNATFGARNSNTVEVRAQYAREIAPRGLGRGTLSARLFGGVEGQYSWGDDVSTAVGGTTVNYSADTHIPTLRGFAGINAVHQLRNGEITSTVEWGLNSSGSISMTANALMKIEF